MQSASKKILVGLLALFVAFAFGRVSAPTKTVEVDRKQVNTNTDRDKHKETVVTEVSKPDGTKTTVTKTTEDTKTDRNTTETDVKSKEVTTNTSKVTVAALVGFRLSDLTKPPVYGLSVYRPILGPITVGVWGLSDTTLGLSVGLSF